MNYLLEQQQKKYTKQENIYIYNLFNLNQDNIKKYRTDLVEHRDGKHETALAAVSLL